MKFRLVMQTCDFKTFWAFFAYYVGQLPELFHVDIGIDSLTLLQQLLEQNTLHVPEYEEYDLATTCDFG